MKTIKNIILGYIAFVAFIWLVHGMFIYYPTTIDKYDQGLLSQVNAEVVSDKGIEWIYVRSDNSQKKMLVHFHGNAGSAMDRLFKIQPWLQEGYDVVLAEYPGYGTNSGDPSEQSFYDVGRVIMDYMTWNYSGHQVYIYGESIGSGTATQMATEYDEKALIIESGFSSLVDIASSKIPFVPFGFIMDDKFDNLSKINNIGSKLLMIHGANDDTISIDLAKELYDEFDGEKEFITVNDAGHNDIYDRANINDFISNLKSYR